MNIGHIILYAIVPIIVVMLAGYLSGKKGVFNGNDAKKFNKVVLDYALPAALFVSIAQASREMLVKDIKLSLISLVVIMFCFMLVYFIYRYCFKKNTGADAAVSALISGSPTIGFLGFAVLEPIFGTTPGVALVVAIVGIVVNAVGIPVGLSLLNASNEKQSGKKRPVVETRAPRLVTARGMGPDTSRNMGSGRYPLARLGKSLLQPDSQSKRLDGRILGRYHPERSQDRDQLAGRARIHTQARTNAGTHAHSRHHIQDGPAQP